MGASSETVSAPRVIRDRLRRTLHVGDPVMVNRYRRGPKGICLMQFIGEGAVCDLRRDGLVTVSIPGYTRGRVGHYLPEQLIRLPRVGEN